MTIRASREAIQEVLPEAARQRCYVHLLRRGDQHGWLTMTPA